MRIVHNTAEIFLSNSFSFDVLQATVIKLRLHDQAYIAWTQNKEASAELKKGSVFAILNPTVTCVNHSYIAKVRYGAQIVKLGECKDIG